MVLNIRTKVVLLLSAVFLFFTVVEWGVGQLLLLPRFEQIERDNATTAMKRIDAALTQALDGLQVSASDWGNWADTYRYMADHNADYGQANLNPTAMRQLHLTALAFIDQNGDFVWWHSIEPQSTTPLPLNLFERKGLPADFPWMENLHTAKPARGLIATNHGVLLAAVAPILDGYGASPSRGLVFMGRLLTDAEIAEIGTRAQTDLGVYATRRIGDPPRSFLPQARARADSTQILTDEQSTQVYRVFNDVFGAPVMTLRVDAPRTITANARATVYSAMAFTLGAAIVALLFTLVALNRTVFEPLGQVTRHAVAIGAGDDLTTRLNLKRNDEIGALANEFDRMVAQVAQSRRQLVDHSFQAGMAEFSRGVLHNIGNAMTPLAVRVAKLQERLRNAPTADLELALAECRTGGAVSSERQADLDEFLRLAGAEMVEIIKAADEDAAMMMRQASVVQTALAERLPSAHAPAVTEAVELPAIIHQSLEIVPDVCREQVDIELDHSLELVGTVWTARTVLRLVLQNLIINAAEAVRARGSERGRVRFSAALICHADQDRLRLECRDSGIGIEAANLQRIFERGFSTKGVASRGIGLHWCATAINALGGRIWATSAGRGLGATLHLEIPVSAPESAVGTIAA